MSLGTDTVAAWTAYSKIDSLFWMIVNAFGISITTFVGQNFGAGKYHRMRKSVSVCMVMSMVSSAVMIILMYSFAPWIYRLFTTDSAVIVHGVHMESFFTAVLFHLCNHRNFVRGTEGYRKGSGAYAPYLWRCVFFENPVAFYSRTDVSGNQYDHAQLSGFMEYYGGAVCCILFHEIPRKGKGRALPETETVTLFS